VALVAAACLGVLAAAVVPVTATDTASTARSSTAAGVESGVPITSIVSVVIRIVSGEALLLL